MIFRNLIFEAEVVEQRLRAGLVPHHEQQTSECSGEQQRRELWPAYNANIALPQASTEGLFQQTQAITQASAVCSPFSGLMSVMGIFHQQSARRGRQRTAHLRLAVVQLRKP